MYQGGREGRCERGECVGSHGGECACLALLVSASVNLSICVPLFVLVQRCKRMFVSIGVCVCVCLRKRMCESVFALM